MMPNDQATRAKEAAEQLFKETMASKKTPPESVSGTALIRMAEQRAEEAIARQRQARLSAAVANSAPANKPKRWRSHS